MPDETDIGRGKRLKVTFCGLLKWGISFLKETFSSHKVRGRRSEGRKRKRKKGGRERKGK